ncbi:hypothetical protein GNY23_03170 [Labilibaculum sp. 44]|uniref:Uncharacterized protein n=2 Tax=Labilibaculum euxinus TaxID=2686357 RepID=A0A7M4D2C9_9BACT|nr:hypothetical protein [Labilibaculum euxinus]MVB06013.1 hypothetical protein [Labilibaculum euxinus]
MKRDYYIQDVIELLIEKLEKEVCDVSFGVGSSPATFTRGKVMQHHFFCCIEDGLSKEDDVNATCNVDKVNEVREIIESLLESTSDNQLPEMVKLKIQHGIENALPSLNCLFRGKLLTSNDSLDSFIY